jgi:hypothetical protein
MTQRRYAETCHSYRIGGLSTLRPVYPYAATPDRLPGVRLVEELIPASLPPGRMDVPITIRTLMRGSKGGMRIQERFDVLFFFRCELEILAPIPAELSPNPPLLTSCKERDLPVHLCGGIGTICLTCNNKRPHFFLTPFFPPFLDRCIM